MNSGTNGLFLLKLSCIRILKNLVLEMLYEFLQTEGQSRFNWRPVGMRTPLKYTSEWLCSCERPYRTTFLIKWTWANKRSKGVIFLIWMLRMKGCPSVVTDRCHSRNGVTFSLCVCPLWVVTAKPCRFMLRWSNGCGIWRVRECVYEHVNYFEWNKMRCVMIGSN